MDLYRHQNRCRQHTCRQHSTCESGDLSGRHTFCLFHDLQLPFFSAPGAFSFQTKKLDPDCDAIFKFLCLFGEHVICRFPAGIGFALISCIKNRTADADVSSPAGNNPEIYMFSKRCGKARTYRLNLPAKAAVPSIANPADRVAVPSIANPAGQSYPYLLRRRSPASGPPIPRQRFRFRWCNRAHPADTGRTCGGSSALPVPQPCGKRCWVAPGSRPCRSR